MTITEPLARIEFAEAHVSYYPPHVQRADEPADFYEVPESLIATYEQAKAAMRAAEDAIRTYLADNKVPQQDGLAAATWVSAEDPR